MVRPEKILKDLSKLWVDLGHEEHDNAPDSGPAEGVLRACAMTLITIVDETEDPGNVGETVAMLMKEHPSRSVLIRLRTSSEECLEARVFAQCWMPFGQRRQICCEQIEITSSLTSLDDVPGVVLPLAVPDLPVILWSRSPRLFETSAFPKIAAMSGKLIVDTGAFADAGKALDLLAEQVGGERLTADLAWARVTRWRETLSQVFANADCLEALGKFTEATIEYGVASPPTEAMYLAGWLQNGLEAAGSRTKVTLERADGPKLGALMLSGGGQCDVSIRSEGNGSIHVTANRLDHHTVFPEATDYRALQEELSITTRDVVFEQALRSAKTFSA